MSNHEEIARIAESAFAAHVIQDAPARSWRLGKPGTGSYAFRVTWAPGLLSISGDIGSAVYEVWPSFNTVEGAIEFVERACFSYLNEKAGFRDEYDSDLTVESIVQRAYADLRNGHRGEIFDQLCDEYGGDGSKAQDRKEAVREFREDSGLTADRVIGITGDFEDLIYRPPAVARWTYEAAKLWAKHMRAAAQAAPQVAE